MRPSLVLPALLITTGACDLSSIAYPRRLPIFQVQCGGDTGACDAVSIQDVPYERTATSEFQVTNPGTAVLELTVGVSDARFVIEPDADSLDVDESATFRLTYTPTGFEPVSATLQFLHNASSLPTAIPVEASTDADADGDGHAHMDSAGGDDCNDQNSSVYPGSEEEECYDNLDQDCDGWSDFDCDRDGYDSELYGGTDCADDDDAVSPGATEIWYDGVDQDCDNASDWDADGDSYDIDSHFGADCDDTDDTIYPGASDPDDDGIDQDCDGQDG